MAEPAVGLTDLDIGSMALRGRGLSPATGQSLASAVAEALAQQLAPRSRHIGAMTVRMPAAVLDAGGGIDRTAVAQAILRARREPDA